MPTKKIADAPIPCSHPEHEPPMWYVFEPGTYEHTCPACGKATVFEVPYVECHAWEGKSPYRNYFGDRRH